MVSMMFIIDGLKSYYKFKEESCTHADSVRLNYVSIITAGGSVKYGIGVYGNCAVFTAEQKAKAEKFKKNHE